MVVLKLFPPEEICQAHGNFINSWALFMLVTLLVFTNLGYLFIIKYNCFGKLSDMDFPGN